MAELKTKKTEMSVDKFIKSIKEKEKQNDAYTIVGLMEKATKAKAKMWGTAIIGFGDTVLKYDSGRTLDWFIMGFSPRKANFALYIHGAVDKQQAALLKKLGKHKTAKSCLYINKLKEVDENVLKEIIQKGLAKETRVVRTKKPVNNPNVKDGSSCKVIAGTHKGKSGKIADVNTSKTGHVTITVIPKNGIRFKTMGRNVEVVK